MLRIRLILVGLISVFGYLFFLSVTSTHEQNTIENRIFFGAITGSLALWTILFLIGLFYKSKAEKDGTICLAPGHPLLKISGFADLMTNEEFTSLGEDQFRPCPLFWSVSIFTVLVIVFLTAALFGLYWLLIAPFFGYMRGLFIVAGIIACWILFRAVNVLWETLSYGIQKLITQTGKLALLSVIGSIVMLALLFLGNFEWETILILIGYLLLGLLGVGLILASLFFLMWLASKAIDKFQDSTVGDWLDNKKIKVKARWCPPVRKCHENDFA